MQVFQTIIDTITSIGTGILGWQIWKSTTLGVPLWVWGIGGAALLFFIFSSNVRKNSIKQILKNPKHLSKQMSSQLRKTRFFICGNCGQKFLNLKQKNDHEKYCYE
jgi:hypothetical protein